MSVDEPARAAVGTATVLLGDVEGSTRLWQRDPDVAQAAMALLEDVVTRVTLQHGAQRPLEQGEGDSFVLLFARAGGAVLAALDLQDRLREAAWPDGAQLRVRVALHTGDLATAPDGRCTGPAFNRCARLRALAHGGQTLMTRATYELVADTLPEAAAVTDLGRVALRDFEREEQVFQLGRAGLPQVFPPLRTGAGRPMNLPLLSGRTVGRDAELDAVADLLDKARLVTLTGAGGSGKTRLAAETMTRLAGQYEDGAWWVDLALVSDPALVPHAVSAALQAGGRPDQPAEEAVLAALRDRELLLALDNCEHVVAVAAAVVDLVLQRCPGVRVLATSREPLGCVDEAALRVPSLAVPEDSDGAHSSPAIQLFTERAARVRDGFRLDEQNTTAVVEICRRLDGLPLAIELAAGRMRMMTAADVAEGLADRFHLLTGGARTALARQRTLEASVEWSYRLLTPQEQHALQRLAVFAGSFSLEAAQSVCADGDVRAYDVLDLLGGLVDKSLVQVQDVRGTSRYRMLETIRAYALNRLAEGEDVAATRDRHLECFLAFTATAQPHLVGPDVEEWLERLDDDVANLRAAMDWALTRARPVDALRIVARAWLLWFSRTQHSEVMGRLGPLLEQTRDAPAADRFQALVAAMMLNTFSDHYALHRYAQEAVGIAEEAGDPSMLCRALSFRGLSGEQIGMGEATDDLDRAVELAREMGDVAQLSRAIHWRGSIATMRGDDELAVRLLEEAVALMRSTRNLVQLPWALAWLGSAQLYSGGRDTGNEPLTEAVALLASRSNDPMMQWSLGLLAYGRFLRGDLDGAEQLAAQARATGTSNMLVFADAVTACVALARGRHDEAADLLQPEASRLKRAGLRLPAADSRILLAEVELARGEYATAGLLLEETQVDARGFRRAEASILGIRSLLAVLQGHPGEAVELAQQALRHGGTTGGERLRVDLLEPLACGLVQQGRHRDAVLLAGATARAREELEAVPFPHRSAVLADHLAAAREALDAAEHDAAWSAGARMSLGEAVAYAQRGRGPRDRPAFGWESLTPAEQQVAELAAQGRTNAAIAQQLFVSPNTVKAHLAHVFAKLEVSSRAELAAAAARR